MYTYTAYERFPYMGTVQLPFVLAYFVWFGICGRIPVDYPSQRVQASIICGLWSQQP